MLRKKIQRLACAANTFAYVLVFGVVVIHVLHRRTAANVGPGEHNVVFWFEAGDDGDDQPPYHRPFSVDPLVVLGSLGTFTIAAVCDAGGTAGTASIMGLFVPLYCLVVGFGLKEATGLAQAAIAGASFTSVAFSLFKSHPWDPSKPLLDLDLALILAPTSVLGVSVGVLLNDLLPTWLITALLVGLLAYVCRRKAIAGLTALHEEAQLEAAQAAAAAISSGPVPQLRPICTASSSNDSSPREAVQQAVQGAVHIHVCTDSSSSSRGSGREAVQQAVQQQWDEPQLPVAAAAAADNKEQEAKFCEHFLSSSGSSNDSLAAAAAASGAASVAVAAVAAADICPSSTVQQQQQQQQKEDAYMRQSPFQQRQQSKERNRVDYALSSSSSTDDLRTPLLDRNERSAAAAAAALDAGSRSSRSTPVTRTHGYVPIVPFMSSVALPLPPVSPVNEPRSLQQPPAATAAAAAVATGARSSAVFAGHVISFSAFPWVKFISMLLLCFGFFGLTMLGGLIPLCSWYFVTYMTSFLSVTVVVTFVFVKVILIDPLATAAAYCKLYSSMEEGSTPSAAAAAAAAAAMGFSSSSSSSNSSSGDRWSSLIERFVTWLNVIFGTELAIKRHQAAAAADGSSSTLPAEQQWEGEHRSLHKTMSMFRRQQLKEQLQLQQPFLHQQHSFTNIKSAAAAAAVAAAAAAEAHDILRADGSEYLDPIDRNTFVPQPSSLVHVAAAGAAVAGAAGVITGVCGLAGAALLVPILLDFRVHPQVATATSVLLVCMSSAGGVLSFLMQGRLVVSYALLFSGVAAAGVCAGVWIIGGLVRWICKPSVVILLLALLTGLAALVTLLFGAEEFAVNLVAGEGLGFRALCSYR